MSKLILAATALSLKAVEIEASTINPIIFDTKVIPSAPGLTKHDGKYYMLDTVKNTSVEVTPEGLTKKALADFKSGKSSFEAVTAENYGMITKVIFEFDADADIKCTGMGSISNLCKALDLKVEDVAVDPQNEIIFSTKVVGTLSGLQKKGSDYYKLDTQKNTATLIDPNGMAKAAVADFTAGKRTDATDVAEAFCLIRKLVLVKKTGDAK